MPELLESQDHYAKFVVEAPEELALELGDLRRDAVGEQGKVELPAVDPEDEVVAPIVGLVEVFVTDAVGGVHERADELPRRGAREVARVDADVEVAPDHQTGDEAADELDGPCVREPRLDGVLVEEGAPLGAQRGRALEQLVVAEHHGRPSSWVRPRKETEHGQDQL